MANQQIEKVNTPVNEAQMAQAFLDGAKELFGITLSKRQLGILIAQNNLETGNRKQMYNYNIGNITHVDGDGHDYFIGGDKTKNNKGEWVPVKARFRSYPNLQAAVKDYLGNLKRRGNGIVWQSIINENPVDFSKALKKTKYYEADEEDSIDPKTGKKRYGYTSSLLTHFNNFTKSNDKVVTTPTEKPDMITRIDNLFNSFMSSFSSENRFTKKALYRNNLLPNDMVIKIKSEDFYDSVEFARILCTALDEELYTNAYTYANKDEVEVGFTIHGPKTLCANSVVELCNTISEEFEKATQKIGGCKMKSIVLINKRSDYQELDIKLAQTCYNIFHLKFIGQD